ncbi:MAG: 2-polyprenyl-3-methyl-5-hydroxy-6-metoxy-1,4-benzoquinol methylase, partial [Marinobacter sp.]
MPEETIGRTRCSLCGSPGLQEFVQAGGRLYRRCRRCQATQMDPAGWLSRPEERTVYELHDNAVDDPGYRRFLNKLATPLLEQLPPACQGLDFGCGPGPALAAMLEARGHRVALYDPAFFPD